MTMAVDPSNSNSGSKNKVHFPSEGERRKIPRVQPSKLDVRVKYRGLLGKIKHSGYVKVIDFNRFGLAFESSYQYRIGDELLFEITLNELSVREVVGFICNFEHNEDFIRYGVQFDFSATKYMRSQKAEEALSEIEKMLK